MERCENFFGLSNSVVLSPFRRPDVPGKLRRVWPSPEICGLIDSTEFDEGSPESHIAWDRERGLEVWTMADMQSISRLVELARSVKMTEAQKEEQRRSFVFGNVAFENPEGAITKEMVAQRDGAMSGN